MFKEANNLELKREYSKSCLKTISAFANERDGKIIFGLSDDGKIYGIEDDSVLKHKIENAINDALRPIPNYTLETVAHLDKKLVFLKVKRGFAIPYLYQGKAYMRSDTSTVVADEFRIRKWFQEISNIDYDNLETDAVHLSYAYLAGKFSETLNLEILGEGELVTLGLKRRENYTNAGVLFADEHDYRYGVDIVKFGKNASEFMNRLRLVGQSILKQYDSAMDFFDLYYHNYEVIYKGVREERVKIPRDAFREVLANAIVHRDYRVKANIQIEFWDDFVKVTSPGGLTSDITIAQYLRGGYSLPRNENIANIFFRLGLIESFGTGIGRIKTIYRSWGQEPHFKVTENTIEIKLPLIDYGRKMQQDTIESKMIALIKDGYNTRPLLEKKLALSATTIKKHLNAIIEKDKIERIGEAKATKYRLK